MKSITTVLITLMLVSCGGESGPEPAKTDPDAIVTADLPGKGGGGNSAPKLHKIGNKEAQIGLELEIVLQADDSDGDALTFSVYGDMPDGAKFYKPEGRFAWTPTTAGGPYFITFVVSDMKEFDSETVELRAVTSKTQHPPKFEPLGDQSLEVGKLFELRVEASDEDGDALNFGYEGTLPNGATFDAANAMFRWTPTAADEGQIHRVTFTVSDGALSAKIEVKLIVGGGGITNQPPVIEPIEPVSAKPGQTIQIQVKASDPDGNTLTYGYEGQLPVGSIFDPVSHTFSWTPSATHAGLSTTIVFTVTDGTFTAKAQATILVETQGGGTCTDDQFDQGQTNNTPENAVEINQGNYPDLSICDTAASPVDIDWFKLQMSAGEHVDATIEFIHTQGDLDIALLFDGNYKLNEAASYTAGIGDIEKVSYTSTGAATYYLAVFGTAAGTYSVSYSLNVIRTTGQVQECQADGMEPNNTIFDAKLIEDNQTDGTPIANLSICPDDKDYYAVLLGCGESLAAGINFIHANGDLDLYLLDDGGFSLDQSAGEADFETVALAGSSKEDFYYVAVEGYPPESADNSYSLEVAIEPGGNCSADQLEPNNSSAEPTQVTETTTWSGLTVCCDKDHFAMPAGPGKVTVGANSPDEGLTAYFVTADDFAEPIALQCNSGQCSGAHDLPAFGVLFMWVEGTYGSTYDISFTVETGGGAEGSCEGHCDSQSGECWCDDICHQFGDCCPDICEKCGYCAA